MFTSARHVMLLCCYAEPHLFHLTRLSPPQQQNISHTLCMHPQQDNTTIINLIWSEQMSSRKKHITHLSWAFAKAFCSFSKRPRAALYILWIMCIWTSETILYCSMLLHPTTTHQAFLHLILPVQRCDNGYRPNREELSCYLDPNKLIVMYG